MSARRARFITLCDDLLADARTAHYAASRRTSVRALRLSDAMLRALYLDPWPFPQGRSLEDELAWARALRTWGLSHWPVKLK